LKPLTAAPLSRICYISGTNYVPFTAIRSHHPWIDGRVLFVGDIGLCFVAG
jgi:hypothetical protein